MAGIVTSTAPSATPASLVTLPVSLTGYRQLVRSVTRGATKLPWIASTPRGSAYRSVRCAAYVKRPLIACPFDRVTTCVMPIVPPRRDSARMDGLWDAHRAHARGGAQSVGDESSSWPASHGLRGAIGYAPAA